MKTINRERQTTRRQVSADLPLNFEIERTLHWMGSVNHDSYLRITGAIKDLLVLDRSRQINLLVTSPGGPTGVAMSFFDLMRQVYRPNLQTVGSGDVDSAGLILFLTGQNRFLTSNTTLLLHLAGRIFDGARRFSTVDMASMLKEDNLKDYQYATIVAEASGQLSADDVLVLMAKNTVLTATEAVALGLAHQVLG